jgi:hypothetical protein
VAASIAVIVIDCVDSQPLAEFWTAALGYEIARRDGTWVILKDPRGVGPPVAIDPVPEAKSGKNRLHLDLEPADTMEAEVARLEQLGARTLRVIENSHTVMADPEGNEFCVLQP